MKKMIPAGLTLIFCFLLMGHPYSQTPTMQQQALQKAKMQPQALQISNMQPQVTTTTIRTSAVQTAEPQTPYFMAYRDGRSEMVVLQWQLLTEANTDHYVVERSLDTVHFAPMHQVVATGLPGPGKLYRDQDENAAGKVNYYRLHIVGKDGSSFYSPAIGVDMSGDISLSVKPTVVNMGSTLRLNTYYDQPLTVNFFDASGRMVATYLIHGNSFDVNTTSWTKGLYVYRFSDPHHPLISSGKIMVL